MFPEKIDRAWVEDRLDTLHPVHVQAFVPLLTELRNLFDGDLDAMLILAACSARVISEDWQATLLEGQQRAAQLHPTNTQSIAMVTGIPRETVRRKILWLERKGWMTRDAQGSWIPTPETAQQLQSGTTAAITYLKTILQAAQRAEPRR